MITKTQIKRIHSILPQRIKHDKEAKKDLIVSFTGSLQKTSTKDLTFHQANLLIKSLGGLPEYQKKTISEETKFAYFDKTNKSHMYLLSLCKQIGWLTFNEKLGYMVADLEHLGSWLKTTGYLKKPLKKYSNTELPKLVNQFQKVVSNQ